MDWQQLEKQSRLLMDEDFSWSDPPRRRRPRIIDEPVLEAYDARGSRAAHARAAQAQAQAQAPRPAVLEPEYPGAAEVWDQPTATHSHFDEMMAQWNAAYGDAPERAFDLDDPGVAPGAQGARRTIVITGHGDDRYMPAPRRSRSAELRFHERSSFSPDRAGLWAVLLGIALLIGCIAH